jgi:hypothetical protein
MWSLLHTSVSCNDSLWACFACFSIVLCSDSVLFGLVIKLEAARFLGLGMCLCKSRTKVQCWSKDFYLHLCKQITDPTTFMLKFFSVQSSSVMKGPDLQIFLFL